MKATRKLGAATLLALALTACGGNGDPKVTVPELAAGFYTVSSGSEDALVVGSYLAAADGTRLLVLDNTQGQASALYRRQASGNWRAVPDTGKDVTVTLLQTHAVVSPSVTLGSLAGRYAVRLASGAAASFTLGAQGELAAGSTACKLSGQASSGSLPGTLALTLSTTGCAGLPATSSGVLVPDRDRAPAAFRLLTDDGNQILDLLAFAE